MKCGVKCMKVAICDSDRQEREKYLKIFSGIAKKHGVNAEFVLYSSGEEMLFHFADKKFMDVLFMNMKMPQMQGDEAAEKLRKLGYKDEIIFITDVCDSRSLLLGYDVGALHYIIKGETSMKKIEEIFMRAKDAVEYRSGKYVLFTTANKWINIPVASIRYFETFRRLVTIHYDDKEFDYYAPSLEKVEQQLADADFIRTHRSYLVALKEISHLTFHTLTTRDGKTLPVGRTFYPRVKEALASFEKIHTTF